MHRRALKGYKKVFGVEYPHTHQHGRAGLNILESRIVE